MKFYKGKIEMKKFLALCCMILSLCACATSKTDNAVGMGETAEQLYKNGYKYLQKTLSFLLLLDCWQRMSLVVICLLFL